MTTKFTPEQAHRWLDVRHYILEEPRRLCMDRGIARAEGSTEAQPPCGTVSCIAGTAVIQEEIRKGVSPAECLAFRLKNRSGYAREAGWWEIREEARRLLGLDEEEAEKVFRPENWPNEFYEEWEEAASKAEEALVVADLIDRILEKGVYW